MKKATFFALAYLALAASARASAITVISGKIAETEFGPIAASGPGAVCAHTQSAAGRDPAGVGSTCSDETMIGPLGKQESVIDQTVTKKIGDDLKNTVGLALQGKTALEAGRGIQYKFEKTDDKPALVADTDSDMLYQRAGAGEFVASALMVVEKDKKMITARGTANAVAKGRGQFAAAIVNDPIYYTADSSTLDPQITMILGNDLSVQADPGDLASAIVQVGKDGQLVLDFAIEVNDSVNSASQAVTPLSCDTAMLGVASCGDYLNSTVLPFLSWDSSTRTLTAISDITLFSMQAPNDGTPVEATLNYAGTAGTVPEPGSLLLLVIPVLFLGLLRGTGAARSCRLHPLRTFAICADT